MAQGNAKSLSGAGATPDDAGAFESQAASWPGGSGQSVIAAGQTETTSGIIRNAVSLGIGAVLTEPSSASLTIFGDVDGPASGSGTIVVADNAALYVAGAVGSSVAVSFAAAAGMLELAALYLPGMSGPIAGFSAGDVLDIISGTVTAAVLASTGNGESLTLRDEGMPIGTLTLADSAAAAGSLFAIPDSIDGTRILLGPAMPPVSRGAPAGSPAGSVFAWGANNSGQWGNAAAWRGPDGVSPSMAPGARDTVAIAGPQSSVLVVAGDGAAASLTTQGLLALVGRFGIGTLAVGVAALDGLVLTTGCQVTAAMGTLRAGVLQIAAAGAMLDVTGLATLQGGTLWVAGGGLFETSELALTGGTLRIGSSGTICVGGTAGMAGTMSVNAGGVMSGHGSLHASVRNDGTMRTTGGVLAVYGPLVGSGVAQIASGSELYLPDGAAAGQQIAFSTGGGTVAGTLELFGSAAACAATITGFGVGDVIDIASGTLSQAAWTPGANGTIGVLDLGAAGTLGLGLASGVDPGRAVFSFSPDGIGGTAITMVPCFCAGTRLATPGGALAAEHIAIGDRLLTRSGAARRVRWIGRRGYGADTLRSEPQLRPVRIHAGALGNGLPRNDLRLSPQHAVALPTPSGMRLIPAVALVDGRSIRREPAEVAVSYVHIELDTHDLLMAEGVAVESFLADGRERRTLFQTTEGRPADSNAECHPRLEDGPALAELRLRFGLGKPGCWTANGIDIQGNLDGLQLGSGYLRIEGWAIQAWEPDRPLSLDILVDGVAHAQVLANRWRPDLDRAGLGGGACAFTAILPYGRTGWAGRITVRPTGIQPAAARDCDRVIGAFLCSPWSANRSGNSPRLS